MKDTTKTITKKVVKAYSINQALVGLGLKEADASTLRYLNYFISQIPIMSADFMYVHPKHNLLTALYEKETQMLISKYSIDKCRKDQMKEEVKAALPNRKDIFIEYDIKEGDPLEEITKASQAINSDLIVIGQKAGASPHGILAKNLARSSTTNLLIVPQSAKTSITNILIPIDFSETSDKALELAIAIHKRLTKPAKITCLHVYDMPNNNFFRDEAPWAEIKKDIERNLIDGFHVFLKNIADDYRQNIEIVLVERKISGTAYYITKYANKNEVDFMIMGARGHSKVHLLLMGSVTEAVIDLNDTIPTLITH